MSRKKGLSLEEKRQRMLEIFYETKECFQLKELEKIAPKQKGITPMSVKEVVQSLVDDDLVDTDKIGTSIYFWSFPSKVLNLKNQKCKGLREKIEEEQMRNKSLKKLIKESQVGKEKSKEREKLFNEYKQKQEFCAKLKAELEMYKDCDPDVLKEKQKQSGIAREAVNRWTDNIFSIKSFVSKRFQVDESVLNKQFSIPEDMDYLE